MDYLIIDDLQKYNIIDYKDEKLLLIEPAGDKFTFIEESFERSNGEYIDVDARVFFRQRWKVDVLGEIPFGSTFTTARTLEYYCCTYDEVIKEQKKSYIMRKVYFKNRLDNNTLGDIFIGF